MGRHLKRGGDSAKPTPHESHEPQSTLTTSTWLKGRRPTAQRSTEKWKALNAIRGLGTDDALVNDVLGAGAGIAPEASRYEQIMANLQQMDFSSAPDTALFYSVAGTGAAAERMAAEKGLTTVVDTEGGSYLNALNVFKRGSGVTAAEAEALWEFVSGQYASGASGEVTAILNNPDPARIYLSIERPILLSNPNVTALNEVTIADLIAEAGNFH